MTSSSQLKDERSRYYTFRDDVSNLASKVLESYNRYYTTSQHVKENYQTDGESGDGGKLKASYESIKETYDMLINQTLPAINRQIDQLSSSIASAEAEEEAEEKRKEEERERKRKEAESKSSR